MTRQEMLDRAEAAARSADLLQTDRDTLLTALRDPSVTKVAVGECVTAEGCKCPAVLAGLWDLETAVMSEEVWRFACAWDDDPQLRVARNARNVIEVVG